MQRLSTPGGPVTTISSATPPIMSRPIVRQDHGGSRALSSRFEPSALVVGDAFFAFIDQGSLAPWTGKAHQQNEVVVGAAAAAAGRLAIGGYAVTYDGGIGPWFVDAFVAATGLAAVHYVILLPPEPTCVERVRSRVGHGLRQPRRNPAHVPGLRGRGRRRPARHRK